jgi:hypothetical protein
MCLAVVWSSPRGDEWVRKQTENDAKTLRVLLNFDTLQKNKKVEEQEEKSAGE